MNTRFAPLLLALVLTGCPETTLVCGEGMIRDGTGECVADPGPDADVVQQDGGRDGGHDAAIDAGTDAGVVCEPACGGDTPYCIDVGDGDPGCVQCRDSGDCGSGVCVNNVCECDSHDDCDEATPICDGGACRACMVAGGECADRDAASPACAADGRCVECTAQDESACGVNSCDPVAQTCTATLRGDVDVCETCLADSECDDGHACVELTYMGSPRGYYCMPQRPAAGCATFTAPWRTTLTPDRPSRSGLPAASYCGINEALTTCEAVRAALGAAGVGCTPGDTTVCPQGGRCASTIGGNRCTYDCNSPLQCPTDPDLMTCPTGGYCGDT